MTGRSLYKFSVLVGISLLVVALTGQASFAKKPTRPPAIPTANIVGVYVDFSAGEIVIDGNNFDAGTSPVVYLAGLGLNVSAYTNQQIAVQLPASILDGDYLLEVLPGGSEDARASWDLTVGAVGPQGPPGEGIQYTDSSSVVCDGTNNGYIWFQSSDSTLRVCDGLGSAKVFAPINNSTSITVSCYYMFVTSGAWMSDFGGLASADALCQEAAANGSRTSQLAASWMALLSTSTVHARDRIALSGPVLRGDGAKVAVGSADLWDGDIANAINRDENGIRNTVEVYTGTRAEGYSDEKNCNDWTSTADVYQAGTGQSLANNGAWIGPASQHCGTLNHLCCISTEPLTWEAPY